MGWTPDKIGDGNPVFFPPGPPSQGIGVPSGKNKETCAEGARPRRFSAQLWGRWPEIAANVRREGPPFVPALDCKAVSRKAAYSFARGE